MYDPWVERLQSEHFEPTNVVIDSWPVLTNMLVCLIKYKTKVTIIFYWIAAWLSSLEESPQAAGHPKIVQPRAPAALQGDCGKTRLLLPVE